MANIERRAKMVAWFDPVELFQTGIQVVVSLAFSARADFRLLEALGRPQTVFPYDNRSELWLDYVADVGDGWNSTHAVASLLGRSTLRVGEHETQRGALLVMGGDQVYPAASRRAYDEKLVAPYEDAFPNADEQPDLYAVPGNHDWYDGLVSFTRLFCQERSLGAWKTRQSRSYFAQRLPHGWWLLGVDVQLESDIDRAQVDYFRDIARGMKAGDRIILCTAEPDWIYGNIYDPSLQKNLAYLENEVTKISGATFAVRLSGDLHHYRRHASKAGVHNITCGGGGAFLHPTHVPLPDPLRVGAPDHQEDFYFQTAYPSPKTSRALAWRNWLFPIYNPTFGFSTAVLYVLWSSSLPHPSPDVDGAVLIEHAIVQTLVTPSALTWVATSLGAFVLFTDTHARWYRYAGGVSHGSMHLIAALYLTWLADRAALLAGFGAESAPARALAFAIVAIGGYIAGAFIMGGYLFTSLSVFGRHANDAFSALRIPDYKSFLRMHFTPRGSLTIYPIGLDAVSRRPVASPRSGNPAFSEEPASLRPTLIEPPIEIP